MSSKITNKEFFLRDVLEIAPELPGMQMVRVFDHQHIERYTITEVEAYRGEEDLACHASKGRTKRTETMYLEGGHLYIYLIYGMYWMANIVCAEENNPQAILLRGVKQVYGPGRLTKLLKIDQSFNRESLLNSKRIWLEEKTEQFKISRGKRIGIEYAGHVWKNKLWRYFIPGYGSKADF